MTHLEPSRLPPLTNSDFFFVGLGGAPIVPSSSFLNDFFLISFQYFPIYFAMHFIFSIRV